MTIKIRYNTEKDKVDKSLPAWRVLVNGKEHLAEHVRIETAAWTTVDEIEPGLIKWHITCEGQASWDSENRLCTIKSQ